MEKHGTPKWSTFLPALVLSPGVVNLDFIQRLCFLRLAICNTIAVSYLALSWCFVPSKVNLSWGYSTFN